MKNKKFIWIIVAVALVAAISVAGTLAYLSLSSDPVTNTFASAGLIEGNENFKLIESKAVPVTNDVGKEVIGSYELNAEETTDANSYTVVPGTTVPKDPYVLIKGGALLQEAYMFIEVSDTTPNEITYDIRDTWVLLTGVTGKNGGAVYAYNGTVSPADDDQSFKIIVNDEVTIGGGYESDAATTHQLQFYAYLSQKVGFDSAAEAWAGCFED